MKISRTGLLCLHFRVGPGAGECAGAPGRRGTDPRAAATSRTAGPCPTAAHPRPRRTQPAGSAAAPTSSPKPAASNFRPLPQSHRCPHAGRSRLVSSDLPAGCRSAICYVDKGHARHFHGSSRLQLQGRRKDSIRRWISASQPVCTTASASPTSTARRAAAPYSATKSWSSPSHTSRATNSPPYQS